ncbi:sigma-70 family RNA polymerase sigma factor [Conexibacter woesei]|uniref:RNA polymerase sigma factor n=1 Tax=Conexibacter woesei (strain DSM 14684 / CCUG 47730 / CIP 108061 / JCM 11494 / NBRC 100937 / ID131577) TaxID=469383 RepID=D3F2Z0_CONWI|nr:sigma-70 family RNA polymerase sigma factor [Conexibacter woesei]ADB54271.1 putative RNA polymerase, sigma 70 family subunit [Conexibacter woesei DSM 14684]
MDLDLLIATHRRPIERHLRRYVGDPGLAEDLAQEVFLRAWLHAPRDVSEERQRAWLFRVARNAAIDALRARRPHDDTSLLDAVGGVAAAAAEDHDERLAIEAALAQLPARDRALVTLQFAGFGPTDAARLLQTTPEAARKRLTRARERFRVVYTDQRPVGEPPLVLLVARDTDTALYERWLGAAELRVRVVAPADAARQLATAHALVLSGSERDIHPAMYGQPVRSATDPRLDVDRADAAVLRDALATRMPVLGICRGHQLLNIVRGGTLHQDLSEQSSAADGHAQGTHRIGTRGSTLARRILGAQGAVPSVHHQAVARIGRGLNVGAISADGVVETIEDPRLPFAVGTQWHAELPEAGETGRRLRDALAQAAFRHAGAAPLPVAA